MDRQRFDGPVHESRLRQRFDASPHDSDLANILTAVLAIRIPAMAAVQSITSVFTAWIDLDQELNCGRNRGYWDHT
jgi:hypothetical protein